jgi:hypothetical protein
VANFLQQNGLVRTPLLHSLDAVIDTFAIRKSDLTDEGFALMKKAYDKWVKALDRGSEPQDVSILEKMLLKMRDDKRDNLTGQS